MDKNQFEDISKSFCKALGSLVPKQKRVRTSYLKSHLVPKEEALSALIETYTL